MSRRLSAKWISRIDAIPHSRDWSLLADFGEGVQLYRLSRDFKIDPIVVRTPTTMIGTDYATAITNSIADFDQAFGVFDYGWARDGRSFWYSTAHLTPKGYLAPVVQTVASMPYNTFQPHVSELRYATLDGLDQVVAAAPGRTNPRTVVA
ncbi:MAG: hypothetical protein B7Z26_11980, partial [Asticcacaulis sp. 32-58-5]